MQGESSENRVEAQGPSSCYERALTDHYRVLSAIGEGRYGQVVLARHLLTWTEVAVKVVPKTERKESTLCEREGLMALEHRNMMQLFQVIETPDNMYLVMEHAGGGSLQCHIPQPGGLPEEKVRRVFRAMVRVLHHCHQQGFVHLDVKPQNFLVDTSGHHLKLIDFGLCMSFTPGQKLKEFRGTLPYCAPEILKRMEFEPPPADVWSLGVTLYFLLTGKRPFRASTKKSLRRRILQGSFHIPGHVSQGARSLILQILRVDPRQRPTLEQVMGHPWLSQAEDPSPSRPSQPLPRQQPDPTILTLMFDMGFDPCTAWLSLANRQLMRPWPPTSSSSTRDARGRAAGSGPGSLWQRPQEAWPSGQKGAAPSASEPAIPLRLLDVRTPPPSAAPQQDQGPQWRMYLRPNTRTWVAEGGSSASQDLSTGQAQERSRGWRGLTRRMATCLRQLCCCMPCFQGPAAQRRVAPMAGGHRPPRFLFRVAPGHVPS
ncbi:sperm motility kinase-like [Marmota flaviventris]|uniref:sperm motility kinase-like n=1 Tax=Marmota flaviventris TaxID=93162 RepID=UPI000FFF863E|nr:sperm motility kinase-like [Marmota flaviventris]